MYKCFIDFWVFKIRVLQILFSNFALSDAEDNTSKLFNGGGVGDLPENNLSGSLKVFRAKLLGSDWLFCFISKCKFGSFKNPFAMITSLSRLEFQKICSVGTNEKSDFYGSSISSWKSWKWVRLDLIFTMWDLCINSNLETVTKFTSSSRSTEFKDILKQ